MPINNTILKNMIETANCSLDNSMEVSLNFKPNRSTKLESMPTERQHRYKKQQ